MSWRQDVWNGATETNLHSKHQKLLTDINSYQNWFGTEVDVLSYENPWPEHAPREYDAEEPTQPALPYWYGPWIPARSGRVDRWVNTWAYGWPFRSIRVVQAVGRYQRFDNPDDEEGASIRTLRLLSPGIKFGPDEYDEGSVVGAHGRDPWVLSLDFLWPGALANTLVFYAAFVMIAIFPKAAIRSHRQRHRHCPNCNYNLRATTTGTCPECGAAIECPARGHWPRGSAERSAS